MSSSVITCSGFGFTLVVAACAPTACTGCAGARCDRVCPFCYTRVSRKLSGVEMVLCGIAAVLLSGFMFARMSDRTQGTEYIAQLCRLFGF